MKLCKCMISNLSALLQDNCYLALDEIRDIIYNDALSDLDKINSIIYVYENSLGI